MRTSIAPPHRRIKRRPATAILAVVATAVIAALVVGAVLAGRAKEYPVGSPEAAAQGYLQAILDYDERAAREFLAPDLAEDCDAAAYAYGFGSADTVRFVDVVIGDRRVEIELEFSFADDYDPFEFPIDDRWHAPRSGSLELEQRNNEWVIVDASWIPDRCRER